MKILNAFFKRDKLLVHIGKEDAELLQFFMSNKSDFEQWFARNNDHFPKIRFTFYYPTTIEFIFDELRLFIASFEKDLTESVVFTQLRASKLNYSNLRTFNWKPFKDVILHYLTVVEQRNTDQTLQRQKALQEYQRLCIQEDQRKETDEGTRLREALTPHLIVPAASFKNPFQLRNEG